MRPDDLRRLLRQQPFRPFRLHVSDGATYDITHPEMAAVTPGAVRVWLRAGRPPAPTVERVVLVSLIHVTRLEVYFPPGIAASLEP